MNFEAMSEAKGPFDAAINCLTVMADRDFANGAPHRGEFRDAIRVLEAAGRVDKMKALDGLEALRAMMSRELFMDVGSTFQSFRALLESLPDKEKK